MNLLLTSAGGFVPLAERDRGAPSYGDL